MDEKADGLRESSVQIIVSEKNPVDSEFKAGLSFHSTPDDRLKTGTT
jgi:hypothetical protein